MDTRAIGVFDSGMGGLTTVRELIRRLPGEDIIYFGDTGRVPYGSRSPETILKYARQDVNFLRGFDLKAIVIACGTVSTIALDTLREENAPIPILGVVTPAVQAAARATRNGKVGLIGTKTTIASGNYERELKKIMPQARAISLACPLFVPAVEAGRFRPGDKLVELLVEEYLTPIKAAGVDTLVLGCTHYPLLSDAIGAFMGPNVTLINSGGACVDSVERLLEEQEMKNPRAEGGQRRYFASDSAADFCALASIFLGENVAGQAEKIAIENY